MINLMRNRQLTSRSGFSLLEVIVALLIIGILGFLILPNVSANKRKGEDNQMKAKANQFNQAMASYMADQSVRNALQNWRNKDDQERYTLIRPFLAYPTNNLSEYIVEGYSVVFPNDPRSQSGVTVTDPEGNQIEYR